MSLSKRLINVFVYGTLKSGEPNHYWLTDVKNGGATFIGAGKTKTKFPLIIGSRFNVPFLLNQPGVGYEINGEIYSVDEKMLANLDVLEDYPQLYDRISIDVDADDKGTHTCLIYVLKHFPESFLAKYTFLNEYKDTIEKPYCETYLESCTAEDLLRE